jgi:hypothetical protein
MKNQPPEYAPPTPVQAGMSNAITGPFACRQYCVFTCVVVAQRQHLNDFE